MPTTPHSPTLRDPLAAGGFNTTRWTQVLQARERTHEGIDALRDLCAAYYAPVIAFLCRRGHDADAARDLAHEFFAGVLEGDAIGGADRVQGRFRSYLLGAVKHFLSHRREAEQRLRRGAGVQPLSLDADEGAAPALAIAGDEALHPDAAFDRQWALTTLDRALQTLRQECAAEGRAALFDLLAPPCKSGQVSYRLLSAPQRAVQRRGAGDDEPVELAASGRLPMPRDFRRALRTKGCGGMLAA